VTPDDYCADKVRRVGSSLYYALSFLSPDRRRAATAVHAFGRELGEVVFECSDPMVARAKLAWWRHEIAALYEGVARHPVARALQPALDTYRLPRTDFQEIVDGAEGDLMQDRYQDFKALSLSCERKAGAVGRLCAEIFGYRDRRSLDAVRELMRAIQLSRIIRDVGTDARRNRIHLPMDDMAQFKVQPTDLLHRRNREGIARLVEFEIDRIQDCIARADAALPSQDRLSQRPHRIMAAIHSVLLDEIRADGCRVLERRTGLTPLRKLWIAWRT
jgi:phytoene synthase